MGHRSLLSLVFVALPAGACSSSSAVSIQVRALGASLPEADVTVVAHRADGHVLDSQQTDSDGRVVLRGEPDVYVTTWLRWNASLADSADLPPGPVRATYAVTTVAPPEGRELVVHGPSDPSLPAAGSLVVNGSPIAGASFYNVFLGCLDAGRLQLPATLAIPPDCVTTDGAIDVAIVAVGQTSSGFAELGHSAAHVPLVAGTTHFDVATWDTTAPVLPVQLDATDTIVRVALRTDQLEILDQLANASTGPTPVELWAGISIDGVTVRGYTPALGAISGAFVRDMAGVPAVVDVSAADFPPPMVPVVTTVKGELPTLAWQSPASTDVALVAMLLTFDYYSWKLVVPPSAGQVSLPGADGTLVRSGPRTRFFELLGASDEDRLGLELELHCETQNTDRVVTPSSGEVLISGSP